MADDNSERVEGTQSAGRLKYSPEWVYVALFSTFTVMLIVPLELSHRLDLGLSWALAWTFWVLGFMLRRFRYQILSWLVGAQIMMFFLYFAAIPTSAPFIP